MKTTLLIIIAILFASCIKEPLTRSSKFVMELPDTSLTHEPDIFYEVKKIAANELNLNLLENGAEPFELRLWTKMEVTNGGQVLIIKKINNQWTCVDYRYLETYTPVKDQKSIVDFVTNFSIDTVWIKKKQPKSGWRNFFTAIHKNKIMDLPVQSQIPGWVNHVTDGYTFYVEYATSNRYKFYWYNTPYVYEDDFSECRYMNNIIFLFNKEFGLMLPGYYKFHYKD